MQLDVDILKKPGFTCEVLNALKSLAPEDENCNIMFDAMSIKKIGT